MWDDDDDDDDEGNAKPATLELLLLLLLEASSWEGQRGPFGLDKKGGCPCGVRREQARGRTGGGR